MTATYLLLVTAIGVGMLIAGLAVIYWPAALVAAGLIAVGFGLVTDSGS